LYEQAVLATGGQAATATLLVELLLKDGGLNRA